MTVALTREETASLGSTKAALVWEAFYDLSQIARQSKYEHGILTSIQHIAERCALTHKSDSFGNLVAFRPGSGKGASSAPVIVQAHVDMVCEKNDDVQHDFLVDPVRFRLQQDGDWLKAHGTTLGADNGLGVAAGAHALRSKNVYASQSVKGICMDIQACASSCPTCKHSTTSA